MDCAIDESLAYVLFITRHAKGRDPVAVIIMMLIDMGFQVHMDGFGYLVDAILLKSKHLKMRIGSVYDEIIESSNEPLSSFHIEQAIRNSIKKAWKNGTHDKWLYFFSGEEIGVKYPSNKVFISKMAYLLEVLYRCGEVTYEAK